VEGATNPDDKTEGMTLADCIEKMLTAEAPDAPNWVQRYAENVLLPAGRREEAIRLLNERIKWNKTASWNQRDYDAAMVCLCQLAPGCFSD
jgi:hypothetical protein